jgi:hypothetical protein
LQLVIQKKEKKLKKKKEGENMHFFRNMKMKFR